MFERFTASARHSVESAARLAAKRGADAVDPEHLLLALAGTPTSAGRALATLGLERRDLIEAIERDEGEVLARVGVHVDAPPPLASPAARRPRFSPASKRALEEALRVALERGDRRLEPGHVLLGLARTPTSRVPAVLARAGVDAEALVAAGAFESAS